MVTFFHETEEQTSYIPPTTTVEPTMFVAYSPIVVDPVKAFSDERSFLLWKTPERYDLKSRGFPQR